MHFDWNSKGNDQNSIEVTIQGYEPYLRLFQSASYGLCCCSAPSYFSWTFKNPYDIQKKRAALEKKKKRKVPSLFDLLITLTSFHIFRTILFIISLIYSNTCWLKNYYEIIARVIDKYYWKNKNKTSL